jgi:hypothetical protein
MMKALTAPKTMLTKLAIGAVAASMLAIGGVATIAGFTDTATTDITVGAGNIDLQLGSAKTATFDLGQNIKPGTSVVKTIVVNNKGSLPLTYTATTGGATGNLAPVIDVTIRDMTVPATPVAVGTSKKMNAVVLPSKTLVATTGTQTLEFTFTWPNGTPAVDNVLQGGTGDSTLTFNAVQ